MDEPDAKSLGKKLNLMNGSYEFHLSKGALIELEFTSFIWEGFPVNRIDIFRSFFLSFPVSNVCFEIFFASFLTPVKCVYIGFLGSLVSVSRLARRGRQSKSRM